MSFAQQMQAFERRTRRRATEAYQDAVFKTARSVIRNTPVDTSRLRSNWNLSIGEPDTSVDWDARDKGQPQETVNKARSNANKLGIDETAWLSNGVYYGIFVNYGTSTMAPRRFVQAGTSHWDRFVQESASEVVK